MSNSTKNTPVQVYKFKLNDGSMILPLEYIRRGIIYLGIHIVYDTDYEDYRCDASKLDDALCSLTPCRDNIYADPYLPRVVYRADIQ